jgi:hypothetical protein
MVSSNDKPAEPIRPQVLLKPSQELELMRYMSIGLYQIVCGNRGPYREFPVHGNSFKFSSIVTSSATGELREIGAFPNCPIHHSDFRQDWKGFDRACQSGGWTQYVAPVFIESYPGRLYSLSFRIVKEKKIYHWFGVGSILTDEWLSQANHIFGQLNITSDFNKYGMLRVIIL